MAVVLKPFLFAGDGFTVESLAAGDERDFGVAAAGLRAAGLIDGEGVEVAPVVDAEPDGDAPAADEAASDEAWQDELPAEGAAPKKRGK